jgi:hypothetical protein
LRCRRPRQAAFNLLKDLSGPEETARLVYLYDETNTGALEEKRGVFDPFFVTQNMLATFVRRRSTAGRLVRSSNHVFSNVYSHFEDQDVNGRLIWKWTLKKQDGGHDREALDREEGAGFCEHGDDYYILQKLYELHIYLLRVIPNNCTFATKYVILIIIYIPFNVSLLISHLQGNSTTMENKKHIDINILT